jgi:fumarylacetoacetate (FAA) hydrolase family protein
LGKAKDNNGSCAIGPFIRLFDEVFTLDTVCQAEVSLLIEERGRRFCTGRRQFHARDQPRSAGSGASDGRRHHQYPDGFMLFLGTMFSPVKDRGAQGGGFTHHLGDRVTIASAALGALVNKCSAAMRSRPGPLACAPCTRTWRSAA